MILLYDRENEKRPLENDKEHKGYPQFKNNY